VIDALCGSEYSGSLILLLEGEVDFVKKFKENVKKRAEPQSRVSAIS